jgi:cell division septum initiation protein DivIVA
VSDRLAELQRQRALAQEQLAWLDREIAKETGQTPVTAAPTPVAAPAAAPSRPAVSEEAAARAAAEIIAQYERPAGSMTQDAKRGCYLYFALALGTVIAGTALAYFLYTRR